MVLFFLAKCLSSSTLVFGWVKVLTSVLLLQVGLFVYRDNHTADLFKSFACCLCSSLGPPLSAFQCFVCFRFRGWRHVFTQWPLWWIMYFPKRRERNSSNYCIDSNRFCSAIKISKDTSCVDCVAGAKSAIYDFCLVRNCCRSVVWSVLFHVTVLSTLLGTPVTQLHGGNPMSEVFEREDPNPPQIAEFLTDRHRTTALDTKA